MKPNIKNIIIGIIAITILGLSCYFIYNKYSDKNDKNDNKKIVENEKKIQDDLITVIKENGLDALAYEEKDITFSEKPSNSQLYLAALYFEKINKGKNYVFTREELDDYYDKLYGYKPSSYPNIKCQVDNEDLYVYKENKYFREDNHPGHGYYGPGFIDSYITDYLNNENDYSISVLFLHGSEIEGYNVNDDNLFNENDEISDYSNDSLIKYFQDNISKFMNTVKYQFTFTKSSGRYILKSFKKVN